MLIPTDLERGPVQRQNGQQNTMSAGIPFKIGFYGGFGGFGGHCSAVVRTVRDHQRGYSKPASMMVDRSLDTALRVYPRAGKWMHLAPTGRVRPGEIAKPSPREDRAHDPAVAPWVFPWIRL